MAWNIVKGDEMKKIAYIGMIVFFGLLVAGCGGGSGGTAESDTAKNTMQKEQSGVDKESKVDSDANSANSTDEAVEDEKSDKDEKDKGDCRVYNPITGLCEDGE
jgi:hypothetical protein